MMKQVPDSLAKILKDFCHMEWYEIDELRAFVNNPNLTAAQNLLVSEFKQQLLDAIELESINPEQYEMLTADYCESKKEVAIKLISIKNIVFGKDGRLT